MSSANTAYASNVDIDAYAYRVTYLVNDTRTKLTRGFDSPVFAKEFVRKLKHSKKCTLVSAPLFK